MSETAKNGYSERRLCSIAGVDSRKNDSIQLGTNNVPEGALFYGIKKSINEL